MTETDACQANLVRISVAVHATELLDFLATLKIVLVDRHIDDRGTACKANLYSL